MSCRLCNSNDEESEIHILKCKEILSEKSLSDEISKISFSDIVGTVNEQISASYPCNTPQTADQASSDDRNSIVYDFGS